MFINMKNATKWRYRTSMVSVLLMVLSISMIAVKGLNWGLDFTGGVVTEIQIKPEITSSEIGPLMDAAMKQDVAVISASEPGRWVLRYAAPAAGQELQNVSTILCAFTQQS